MENGYYLVKGHHKDDRYSFIELYDSNDKVYYHVDNGKIKKDFLLDFEQEYYNDHKIPISKEKFNWILEQKILIRNVDEIYFLKILGLHEWLI